MATSRARGKRAERAPTRQGAGARRRSGARPVPPSSRAKSGALDYGSSLEQIVQIEVDRLHARGIRGEGVRGLVLDTGFVPEHEALDQELPDQPGPARAQGGPDGDLAPASGPPRRSTQVLPSSVR